MNTNTTAPAARIAAARAIGSGIRKLDTTVAEIVDALPAGFDPKARGAVTSFVSEWINGDAEAPAQKVGPKGEQTMTDYGRGFDAIVSAVKRALAVPPAKSVKLTVTYVDADGSSHSREIDATTGLFAELTTTLFGTEPAPVDSRSEFGDDSIAN